MESIKNKQKTQNKNINVQENCDSSDSKSQKNKHSTKINHDTSFDSENYQDSSLEVSNFSKDQLNDNHSNSIYKPRKLSSIPESVNEENEEQSSSKMNFEKTGSKMQLIEVTKSTQQNGKIIINKIVSKDVISPIFCCENTNGHQEISFTVKNDEFYKNKNITNEGNEIEVDNNIIRLTCKQCICASSSCQIF